MACSDDEAADIVGRRPLRRDEVGEGRVAPVAGLFHLLTQGVEAGELFLAAFVRIKNDVVALRIGGPETDHRARGKALFGDDPVEQSAGVLEQGRGRLPHHLVGQDVGIAADEVPALEEGRPVDGLGKLGQIKGLEGAKAKEAGLRRRIARPVDGEGLGAGGAEGRAVARRLPPRELGADAVIVRLDLRPRRLVRVLGQEQRHRAHRAARVQHILRRARRIGRGDLHGGVGLGRGRAADQQGDLQAPPLHLLPDEHHLVEGGGDEAGQANRVGLMLHRRVDDPVRRNHDAKVDHLVIVALQHDADDVLADVVHVALHGRHDDPARALLLALGLVELHVGQKVRDGLLHHAGGLDHLRQEHLSGAEEVADPAHPGHQGAFDHLQRALGFEARSFRVLDDVVIDPVHQGVGQSLGDRLVPPLQVNDPGLGLVALVVWGDVDQPLRRVVAAVQDHVLHRVAQGEGNGVVDRQLARIDDAHVHARRDGVIEEDAVDRPAHRLVAAEAERDVGDAPRHPRIGQSALDLSHRLDEVEGVGVVRLDPRRHGEDVGIEDDVFRRKADLVGQKLVGACADLDLAPGRIRLAFLVEGHDHHGCAIAQAGPRLGEKLVFPRLEGDGIDDGLALHTAKARLDHRPFG